VYTERVASHVGGYDEFTVDITDHSAKILRDPAQKGVVPVAVFVTTRATSKSSHPILMTSLYMEVSTDM
jgi:hypothetical protein